MTSQTTTNFLSEWAITVSKTSDHLTAYINETRGKDEECKNAFLDFHKALTEIYPLLDISDCVHMISESIIIGPIQRILFDNRSNKFDAHLHKYTQRVVETLKRDEVSSAINGLTELYDFIKAKSLKLERSQLITEIYDDFYKQALPNRVARHKKIFGS